MRKQRKVKKDLAKHRNAWKSVIRNCPSHASMKNRHYNKYDDDFAAVVEPLQLYPKVHSVK